MSEQLIPAMLFLALYILLLGVGGWASDRRGRRVPPVPMPRRWDGSPQAHPTYRRLAGFMITTATIDEYHDWSTR